MKCHNCNNGLVDGGNEKRIKKEIQELENKKHNELNNIKEKDEYKRKILKNKIHEKYNEFLIKKVNEPRIQQKKCLYCNGIGIR